MASAGDVIDEEIRVAGDPDDAVRRILAVIDGARSHQVVVEGPESYRLVRRYRPGWAVPLAVVKSTESCAIHVHRGPGSAGGVLRLVGRLPRTALAAVRLAVEEPPRYAPPARDPRWRTGEPGWAPASVPATQATMPAPAEMSPPITGRPVSESSPAYRPAVPVPGDGVAGSTMRVPLAPAGTDAPLTGDPTMPGHAGSAPAPDAARLADAAAPAAPAAPAPAAPAAPAPAAPAAPAPAAPTSAASDEPANRTVPRQPRAVAAARPVYAAMFDTGEQVRLDGPVVVGRAPALAVGESGQLLPINDPDFSISKTHLAVGADIDGPWVMDRHSLNGTAIVRSEGEISCPPGERVHVAVGETVYFGNRRFTVRPHATDAR